MAQYVEGPYIVEDQPDGTRKVVGYANQAGGQPAPRTFGTPKPEKPERPNTIQRKDGSIVQVFPDGRVVTVSGPVADGSTGSGGKAEVTAKIRADAIEQYRAAQDIDRAIAGLERLYQQGPGSTSGPLGALDYFNTPANQTFNDYANQLRGPLKQALGMTGGENNTATEGQQNLGGYLPQSSDFDRNILEKINSLRDLQRESAAKAIAVLGGIPDANGNITPVSEAPQPARDDAPPVMGAPAAPKGPDRSSRLPVDPNFDPQGQAALGIGNFTTDADKRAYAAMTSAFQRGASIQDMMQLNNDLGGIWRPEQINEAISYRDGTGRYANQGPQPGFRFQMPSTGQRSGFERGVNAALTWEDPIAGFSPGAAAAAAGNATTLGAFQALAPEAMAQLRGSNPGSSFAGDVAGIVGATSLIAKGGQKLAGKLAPSLLTGGGRTGNAIRAVAPDAVYGAGYGAMTEGDPLTGAATAAVGSGAGQLLAKGVGKVFAGARLDPNAQKLRDAGMRNLTVGQSLGGFAKSMEDAGTSAPWIGDLINARRAEGLQEFNIGRLNDAGAPIGATVTETGEEGIGQLMTQVGSAYDNATAGVSLPLDAQFVADMQAAAMAGRRLPADYQARFDKIGQNRLGPIVDAGQLTGETYQQSMRGLKNARSTAGQAAPGFEQDYRDAVTLSMDALRGQMERGGGQSVIDGLANADKANRLGKTLQNAMASAKNDAGGAGVQIFTPAQLNTAAYAAQKKYPGPRPFADITDAAQMVLPSKIPDSGTARRGAAILLPVSLGGTGAGIDYAMTQNPAEGAGTGATIGALLALGGSKTGQKALDSLLFKRGAKAKKVGGIFGSRKLQKALGASVAAPLLVGQ